MKNAIRETRETLNVIADAVYAAKAMRKGRKVITDENGNVWVRANRA